MSQLHGSSFGKDPLYIAELEFTLASAGRHVKVAGNGWFDHIALPRGRTPLQVVPARLLAGVSGGEVLERSQVHTVSACSCRVRVEESVPPGHRVLRGHRVPAIACFHLEQVSSRFGDQPEDLLAAAD